MKASSGRKGKNRAYAAHSVTCLVGMICRSHFRRTPEVSSRTGFFTQEEPIRSEETQHTIAFAAQQEVCKAVAGSVGLLVREEPDGSLSILQHGDGWTTVFSGVRPENVTIER